MLKACETRHLGKNEMVILNTAKAIISKIRGGN